MNNGKDFGKVKSLVVIRDKARAITPGETPQKSLILPPVPHFHKRGRSTSKPNIFLLLQNLREVKIIIFHGF